jgi:hypothetical protein
MRRHKLGHELALQLALDIRRFLLRGAALLLCLAQPGLRAVVVLERLFEPVRE